MLQIDFQLQYVLTHAHNPYSNQTQKTIFFHPSLAQQPSPPQLVPQAISTCKKFNVILKHSNSTHDKQIASTLVNYIIVPNFIVPNFSGHLSCKIIHPCAWTCWAFLREKLYPQKHPTHRFTHAKYWVMVVRVT